MRLNQHSWHARLHIFVYGHLPYRTSICPYFWSVVLGILLIPGALINHNTMARTVTKNIAKGLLYLGVGGILFLLGVSLMMIILVSGIWFLLFITGLALGFLGLFLSALFLAAWGMDRLVGRLEKHPPRPPRPKTPNLLVEFLKAKKRKVCPIITWS